LFVLAINELYISLQEAMASNFFAGIKLGPNCRYTGGSDLIIICSGDIANNHQARWMLATHAAPRE
jgi:hypothetical protein